MIPSSVLRATTVAMFAFAAAAGCRAGAFSATLPEFSGNGTNTTQTLGTFVVSLPAGEQVVAAELHGQFGNSVVPTTSMHDVFADGILVASCPSHESACWPPPGPVHPWSYTFTAAQLSIFADGLVVVTTTQYDCCEFAIVREGELSLTGVTAAVPETGSAVLLSGGLALLVWTRRRRPGARSSASARCRALVPAALLLALPAARADVLVDNLSRPVSATSVLPSDLWAAQSFVTGGDPVRLLDIQLPIGLAVGAPTVFAELHADAGPQQVGATLASFVLPTLDAGSLKVEFLPSVPTVALAARTTYWVVLGVVGEGSFGWSYAVDTASSGPGTFANYAYSVDAGATWLDYGNERPYHLSVDVSPVPEGGTAALLSAGLALLVWTRRRMRAA
jgi:hypothetical protein